MVGGQCRYKRTERDRERDRIAAGEKGLLFIGFPAKATTPRVGGYDKKAVAATGATAVTTTRTIHKTATATAYLEALDEQRVYGRVQLLSRLRSEVNDDLLENCFHFRPLHNRHVGQTKGQNSLKALQKIKTAANSAGFSLQQHTHVPASRKIERTCRFGNSLG